MKLPTKRLFPVGVAITVVAVVAMMFWPKPVEVDMAQVVRGPLRVTIDEDGKTRIKERYIVSAPLAGRLMRIELHAGDAVTAGQTLVALIEPIDPVLLDARQRAQAEARVGSAEAALQRCVPELDRIKAMLELAQSDHKQLKQQFKLHAASQKELDDAALQVRVREQEYKAANFAKDIARFELEQAKSALLRTQVHSQAHLADQPFEIFAPCDGRVLRVFHENAAVVSAGVPLLEIGDPTDLEVEVDVLSSDAVKIAPGAQVFLEDWGGEDPLQGVVRLVEPSGFTKVSALGVEEQRVNVIIDLIDLPEKWQTLGDSYRVEARIVNWEGQDVLKVPASALFRHMGSWATFLVNDGRAVLRPVKIGHRSALEAEVLEGLLESDQVVLHPSDQVSDGVRVAVR